MTRLVAALSITFAFGCTTASDDDDDDADASTSGMDSTGGDTPLTHGTVTIELRRGGCRD